MLSVILRNCIVLNNIQGDQIGQNFATWAIFYGKIFSRKKSPNDLGKILAMKK